MTTPTPSSYPQSPRLIINGRFLLQSVTGVQRYAREWTQALDAWLVDYPDWRVTIIMPRRWSFHPPLPTYRHINIRQVGWLQGPPWEQIEFPFYIKNETVMCLGNTAPIVSLWQKKAINVTVHDLSVFNFPKAYKWHFRLLYRIVIPSIMRFAKHVITVSEHEKQKIVARYPWVATRITAIQNGGISPSTLMTNMSSPPRKLNTLLYVGSLSALKNFPRLFRVMVKLAQSRGFHFVVIGDVGGGVSAEIEKLDDTHRSFIQFLGQINDWSTLMHHYQTATALVFPSLYESSSLPPLEAMALRCPVISSNIPAQKERCGTAAHYCDPNDDASLEAAIIQVMDDPALQEQLRQEGLRRAAQFTWQNALKESLAVIFPTQH